jgi:hypothetical protein
LLFHPSTALLSFSFFSLCVFFASQNWHKPLFPLDSSDYLGLACAVFGLILASGGGIGGGGMLVPIYVLIMVRKKNSILLRSAAAANVPDLLLETPSINVAHLSDLMLSNLRNSLIALFLFLFLSLIQRAFPPSTRSLCPT